MKRLGANGQAIMKTQRAKEHIDALNAQLSSFINESNASAIEDYIEGPRYVRRTKIHLPTYTLGMLVGEILYCLRSGLDQMAWTFALSISKSNPKTERRICFPIFESITENKDRESWNRVIQCFPDPVAQVIESFQPYKGPASPKDHLLWQLNHLCNTDKHRGIPVHSRNVNIFVPTNPAAIVRHFEYADIFEVSVPLSAMNEMQFKPDSSTRIEIGDWHTDIAFPVTILTDIHDFIRDKVIPAFSGFVPEGPLYPTPSFRIANRKRFRPDSCRKSEGVFS